MAIIVTKGEPVSEEKPAVVTTKTDPIAENPTLTQEDAKALMQKFATAFPVVKDWHAKVALDIETGEAWKSGFTLKPYQAKVLDTEASFKAQYMNDWSHYQIKAYNVALDETVTPLFHPLDILRAARVSFFSYGQVWAVSILDSAISYLQTGKLRIPEQSEFTTRDYFGISPEPILILRDAIAKMESTLLVNSMERAVHYLDSPVTYSGALPSVTAMFFEGTGEFAEFTLKPFESYAKPKKFQPILPPDTEPEEVIEPDMQMCCDGKGAHEFDANEQDESDCECRVLDCNCIYDPDGSDVYVCSNCESICEECCENCTNCNDCGERVGSGNVCDNCDCCKHCCQKAGECQYCDSCEKYRSSEKFPCDNCSDCEDCCECLHCEACEASHDSDTPFCTECISCKEECSCIPTCCGLSEESAPILCKKCRHCIHCGCSCPPPPAPPAPPYKVRTQKAIGLRALTGQGYAVSSYTVLGIENTKPEQLIGRFVRPCPMVPRHGFVDSRYINNTEEAEKIINETRAADEKAEFILMSEIPAEISGVWTPGLMVLGPGNDGATAGKNSVTVPIAGNLLFNDDILTRAGITNAPYMELLWCSDGAATPYAVQLRDGPKLPQQIDYIAKDTTVTKVVLAGGDLLEWETTMKNQPAGTVVYHPGGSLASHYAVHAVLNGIPVLISKEPTVGDVLKADTGETEPSKPDMDKVRAGFFYALTVKTPLSASGTAACYMMLTGCHSTALWLGKHDALLGAALGFAYRLTVTAAVGEWRHRPTRPETKKTREEVYDSVWNRSFKARGLYTKTLRDFRVLAWADGMGGEKWFQFTRWGASILNAVIAGDMTTALAAMNNAIHSSHNNGWGFNKFCPNDAMSLAASSPVRALQKCASLVYGALTMSDGDRHDAQRWFAKVKPLLIEKHDAWLKRRPEALRKTARIAQAKLDGSTIVVQYKQGGNSKAYATEVLPVPDGKLDAITSIMGHMLEDGRLMVSLVPDETAIYAPLSVEGEPGEWRLYDFRDGKAVDLYPKPVSEETNTWSIVTPAAF